MVKKYFKELTQDWTEEEYRAHPAYHYSALAAYARAGFEAIATLDEPRTSDALTFGSMVDTLVTEGQKAFYKKFASAPATMPSDSIIAIVTAIFEATDGAILFNQIDDSLILEKAEGYFLNIKDPVKRVEKIRKEGESYYDNLVCNKGKIIVPAEFITDAFNCVIALKDSVCGKMLFAESNMEGGIEVLHQPKLLTEYAGIPIKVMLDFVLVDHNAKKIYIKDLKTTGAPEYLFYKSFVKWNYDIQAELYKYAVETVIKTDEAFKDYSVEPFAFIVVNKKFLQPMEWQYEPEKYLVSEQAAKQVGLSNWRGLLMSLDYEKALSVPMGMTTNEPNDLMAFIVNSAHSQGMDVDIVEANDDSIA